MVAGSHHSAGARLTDLCGDYDDASAPPSQRNIQIKTLDTEEAYRANARKRTLALFVPSTVRILICSQFPQLELLSLTQRFTAGLDRSEETMLGTILIIVLILLLIGALPTWPYSGGWGYYPGGGLGLILVIVIVLVLVGRI